MKVKILLFTTLALVILIVFTKLSFQRNNNKNSTLEKAKATRITSSPTIVLIPSRKDLGTVLYGEVAQTSFSLANSTDQPITITRVSTSCGCTKAEIEKDRLDPYEKTNINVSFDPAVHQDETDLGQVIRTIYIETDHSEFSYLTADITANVIKR